jgi:nitroreductase
MSRRQLAGQPARERPGPPARAAPAIGQPDFLAAVEAATRAPSMHNTQPWRFRLAGGCLEVLADPQRALPVADPTGWAVRLACGSAICNARLALAVAHLATEVALRPDPADIHLMARLRAADRRAPTPQERALHAAIPRRHSNRLPLLPAPVVPELRGRLRAAAQERGAWLELLVGRVPLAAVAEIAWAADAALRRDAAYQAEQRGWSGRTGDAVDGVSQAAAGPGPAAEDLLPLRDFGGSPRAQGRDHETDPLVAILGTAGDTARDQLVAGIALQYLLLTATDAGLAASLISQPIEVPAAREQLRLALRRTGTPQMVLRIGYGQQTGASPRRQATDVIDP